MPYLLPLNDTPPDAGIDIDTVTIAFATPALDPLTGDLTIPPALAHGAEAVRLRILSRLRMFRGEWFLDVRLGMPYFRAVLVKNPDLTLIGSVFRSAILSTPGVKSIMSLEVRFDRSTRSIIIDSLRIVLVGNVEFTADGDDFIIPLPGAL